MRTTYISLPSKDPSVIRGSGGNYLIQLGSPLECNSKNCEVFLLEGTFPFTWHNVTEENGKLELAGGVEKIIAPGYYQSIEEIIKAIGLPKSYKIEGNPSTLRTTIQIARGDSLGGPLLQLLGFPKGSTLQGGAAHISPNVVDLTNGVTSLFIYISIIRDAIVGSFRVPLLKEVPIGSAVPGDIIQWRARSPVETHQLKEDTIHSIEVDIKNVHNQTVDFNGYNVSIRIGIREIDAN